MAGDDGRAQVQLDEDTLARRRRDLGEDHPDTLASADGLAISLRAVGGYPGALAAASNLATVVRHRGEHQAARELGEDTLARRRRVLGEDHPDSLASADNLAVSLQGSAGRRPGSWAKTRWPAAAASSARTTPTP
jgi:hypothetical protein